MAESGSFRTVFNGFHKKQVLEYIDAMQSHNTDELQQKQEQLDKMQNALTSQENFVAELKAQIEQCKSNADSLQEENEQLVRSKDDNNRLVKDFHRLAQEADILRLEKQELNARINDMQNRIDTVTDLEQKVKTLTDQISQFSKQHDDEMSREQLDENTIDSLRIENEKFELQLQQMSAKLENSENELNDMREANRKYDGLVGDVGAFIMELHTMGQRFLETAYKRSDGCLKAVENSVFALSSQLTDARSQVEQARQELLDHGSLAGLRLDELVQTLEDSAGAFATTDEQNEKADE